MRSTKDLKSADPSITRPHVEGEASVEGRFGFIGSPDFSELSTPMLYEVFGHWSIPIKYTPISNQSPKSPDLSRPLFGAFPFRRLSSSTLEIPTLGITPGRHKTQVGSKMSVKTSQEGCF